MSEEKSIIQQLAEEAKKRREKIEKMRPVEEKVEKTGEVEDDGLHPAIRERRALERGEKPSATTASSFKDMLKGLGINTRQGQMADRSNIRIHSFQFQDEGLLISFTARDFQGQFAISFGEDQDLNWACQAFKNIVLDAVAKRIQL